MKTFKALVESTEFVLEVKAMRAWSGRLEKIDQLLSWMYDKDILTKAEKNKKDSIFNRYYRYYNDGDFPRGIKVSKYDTKAAIETALEDMLEIFIRRILSKYWKKIDRKEFKIDSAISSLSQVLSVTDNYNVHGLTKYWKKDVSDPVILAAISKLEKQYDALDAATGSTNIGMTYRRDDMLASGTWTKQNEKAWIEIQKGMVEISDKLNMIILSLNKMKKLRAIGK